MKQAVSRKSTNVFSQHIIMWLNEGFFSQKQDESSRWLLNVIHDYMLTRKLALKPIILHVNVHC